MSTQLPIFILVNSSAVFQKCKSHILMWFDQQFYTAQPWPLSLSATHLYCWYAWLFYSVDHVWFNMPGYINSSETQMATQVLKKQLGCFAVVTRYIPLLMVTKSNLGKASRGKIITHWTLPGIAAAQKADPFCQPTSSSKMCRACKVSGCPSSPSSSYWSVLCTAN